MSLDPEYWRPNNLTDDISKCLILGACVGGTDSECAAGYTGVLCGACEEGYYRYGMWRCRDCAKDIGGTARGVIIGVLVLAITIIPSQLSLRSEGWIYRLALALRIFLNYTHMILFVLLLHLEWQWKVLVHHEILRVIGSFGAVLVYSGCQFRHVDIGEFYFQVVVVAFYPLLLAISAGIIWLVANIKLHYALKTLCKRILVSSLICIYTFLPVLSLLTISLYQCQEISGRDWLVADMSQPCWTGSHLLYIATLSVPLLLFLVLSHAFVIYTLGRKMKEGVLSDFHKYLSAGLQSKFQHWERRILIRKAEMVLLSLAYPHLDSFSQVILFNCIIGAAIQKDIIVLPYISKWLNAMHVMTYISIFAIVSVADSGSDIAISTVSCTGTGLILVFACFSIRDKMTDRGLQYAVEEHSLNSEYPVLGKESRLFPGSEFSIQ